MTLTGSLNGEAGADILTVATDNTAAVLSGADSNGFDGSITEVSGTFKGIDTLNATGTGTEVLTGADLVNLWDVDAETIITNTQTLTHTGFELLNGGSVVDTFNLSASAAAIITGGGGNDAFNITADSVVLTGSFDGGAGTDTFSVSGYTSAVTTTLTAPGTSGFNGTSTGLSIGFTNVDVLTSGSNVGDILNGDDAARTGRWALRRFTPAEVRACCSRLMRP